MLSQLRRTKRFDDRIYQSVPSWVVEQGAVSLTSAPFQSLSATAGYVNFQIQSPSKAVYMDRKVDWEMRVQVQMTVNVNAAPAIVGQVIPVVTPGRDFSLCSYPLHALTNSMSASICDQQVSTNLAQNREIMDRLTDSVSDREWATSPACLDIFADNNEAYGSSMNPIGGIDSSTTFATIGNGAWPLVFTNAAGAVTTPYTDSNGNVITFDAVTGIPLITYAGPASAPQAAVQIYFYFRSSEPLQCSPFIWKDAAERRTGLSQLQNLNVSMTMLSARQAKLLRCTTANGRSVTDYSLLPLAGSPFSEASLYVQFLSPPMTAELPYQPVNTVDYQGITAYVYPASSPSAGSFQVTTQTLSLNTVPDWLVIAVQPLPSYAAGPLAINQGTWYYPILSVNVTWSNVTGLLSNLTQQQLYQISKCNGLKMPWQQWTGKAQSSATSGQVAPSTSWLTGGPMILRPGVDIALPPGTAAGQSNGQWTFSVQITVDTSGIPSSVYVPAGCQTTVLAISSGFFTTSSGTSRIVTGPIPGPGSTFGTNPEDPNALSSIPSSGPLFRPAALQITDDGRVPGGGRRPLSMRQRMM